MDFRSRNGKRYRTGVTVGKGGEATVYSIAGQPLWLAKIFSREKKEREHKLEWMIAYPPDDPAEKMGHRSIAWPVDILYDQDGLAGYLMPNIKDAVPVLNVFHPRLRLQTFRGFTLIHLHNTAYNIAAALGAIHQRGYVVGDLNESNVLVSQKTLVTLIDTDSFQVITRTNAGGRRTHLCEVGKPEYLPPEMQRRDLKKTVRRPEHDRFALAVLIFQLLYDGNHPFRARWVSSKEKLSLPERIEKGLIPYRSQARKFVEPVVDLHLAHPLLADAFKRCFIIGHEVPSARPTPGEWEQLLAETMKSLVHCKNGHVYSPHLDLCPECQKSPLPVRRPVQVRKIESKPAAVSPGPAATGQARPSSPTVTFRPRIPHLPLPKSLRPQLPPRVPTSWPARFPGYTTGMSSIRRWLRRRGLNNYLVQPGIWGVAGFLSGGLLGLSMSGAAVGHIFGLIGGLISGAFAGAWIERKIGWGPFFGIFGVLAGLLAWFWFGAATTLVSWIIAGAIGGVLGLIFGLYGRIAELTLLWAASGAVGGWYLGENIAGLVSLDWLGGALSGGTLAMVTGMAYAIWRRR